MAPTNAYSTDTRLTLRDYADLPEDERLELSHGPLVPEPAPGPVHGHVVLRFAPVVSRIADEADAGAGADDLVAGLRLPVEDLFG